MAGRTTQRRARSKGRLTPGVLALSWVLVACARGQGPYERALDQAHQLTLAGRHEEAADQYGRAAQLARKPDDEVEALYREAMAAKRAERLARAAEILERLAGRVPPTERSARALLDLARILEKQGRVKAARAHYRRVIDEHPDSGLAEGAAGALSRLDGRPAALVYRELLETPRPADLDGFLRARLADALVSDGEEVRAIAVLEDLVRRHPLPRGTHSDEALLRAAQLRRGLGDAHGALQTLEVLLEVDRKSALAGSYERGSYARARFLQAEIHRDELSAARRAEELFVAVASQHPDSRLGDDALWQAAFLARLRGQDAACHIARKIQRRVPKSPLERCLFLVCPEFSPERVSSCKTHLRAIPERYRKAATPSAGSL